VKLQLATVALALVFVAVAAMLGELRRAAMLGAAISGVTAITSIVWMGRAVRTARKPTQAAFLVVTVMFLARLVLVGVGTLLVYGQGDQTVAFIASFFAPYFVFSALESYFVHTLKSTGKPA
jgi:hypothetical protein